MALQVHLQDLGQVVFVHGARQQYLQRVRQEDRGVVVCHEERVLAKDVALMRTLHMRLQRQHALSLGGLEQLVKHQQQV